MQVSLEQFEQWQSFKRAINACPLTEIIWTRDGQPVDVPSKLLAEFSETGLSNCMFPEIAGLIASE
jgi:hypothetical protein